MFKNCSEFSERDVKKAVEGLYSLYTAKMHPAQEPTAYLLGGQSGSGKTTIHDILRSENPNTVVIDGDRFREFHPNFNKIQQRYGKLAANYTQQFSNSVVNAMIERLSDEHYNLIIEGTCRTAEVPLNTCKLLKDKGYIVNLAVMCTDKETSWQSTINRYNEMAAHDVYPRAVPREKYDEMIRAIPENISKLYRSGEFSNILLYNRDKERLYSFKETPNQDPSEIFRQILNGQKVQLVSTPSSSFVQNLDDFAKRVRAENAARSNPTQTRDNRGKKR